MKNLFPWHANNDLFRSALICTLLNALNLAIFVAVATGVYRLVTR